MLSLRPALLRSCAAASPRTALLKGAAAALAVRPLVVAAVRGASSATLSGGTSGPMTTTTTAAAAAAAASAAAAAASSGAHAAEAEALFEGVWKDLEAARGGPHTMSFPREVVWLSGAPGAGKGTMGNAVKKERDIAHIVEVSALLGSPRFQAMKEAGELISDREVLEAVLVELMDAKYREGVIIDGFPRTVCQAHAIVSLKRRLDERTEAMASTPALRSVHRRSLFNIVVLYCSEEESVTRQLRRGQQVARTNRVAQETGVGDVKQARATDVDAAAARKRYRIFQEEVFHSLQAIRHAFPFHFINADAPPDEVRRQISKELHYVSSIDLSPEAYAAVHQVESASRVIQQARTKMVSRLNSAATEFPALTSQVVALLNSEIMPIVRRQALAGKAVVRTNSPLLENPVAVNVLLDVLAERGFRVVLDVVRAKVPTVIDAAVYGDASGQRVQCRTERTFIFRIEFPRPEIRRADTG